MFQQFCNFLIKKSILLYSRTADNGVWIIMVEHLHYNIRRAEGRKVLKRSQPRKTIVACGTLMDIDTRAKILGR